MLTFGVNNRKYRRTLTNTAGNANISSSYRIRRSIQILLYIRNTKSRRLSESYPWPRMGLGIINKLGETKNGLSKSSPKADVWCHRTQHEMCWVRSRHQRTSFPADPERRRNLWQNLLPGVQPKTSKRHWRRKSRGLWWWRSTKRPVLIEIKKTVPLSGTVFCYKL